LCFRLLLGVLQRFQAALESRRVGNLFAHLNEQDGGMMVGNKLPTLRGCGLGGWAA